MKLRLVIRINLHGKGLNFQFPGGFPDDSASRARRLLFPEIPLKINRYDFQEELLFRNVPGSDRSGYYDRFCGLIHSFMKQCL